MPTHASDALPFVPAHIDPSDLAALEPLYSALVARELSTPAALEAWLRDFSDLSCAVAEYGSRTRIAKACNTEDEEIDRQFVHWIAQIEPAIKTWSFELQTKYIETDPQLRAPFGARFEVLDREWTTAVRLFRRENVPLETLVQERIADHDRIQGAVIVDFQGGSYTPQQMARFQEDADRQTREAAWRAVERRRLADEDALNAVFDELLTLRGQLATNAGLADYREYTWQAFNRFDYTVADCHAFADAVEALCVPIAHELDRRRAAALQLPVLRPWDAAVDPYQRPPLRPFDPDDPVGFAERTAEVFDRVDAALGRQFRRLKNGRNLDLVSRRAKRPGGFQDNLERSRETFIFMNAAGLQTDVDTMLHEAGHAFHAMASFEQNDLMFQRTPGAEFCEVASMSMELLGHPHLDVFYGRGWRDVPADPARPMRANRVHLEKIVRILPWIAVIDQFQHWLYTHPNHAREERTDAWMAIYARFFDSPHIDWTDLGFARRIRWQRQIHLFDYPFYYIEYGIAQLGALQVWLNYRQHSQRTLEQLLHAFALGNTRPLPELFAAAGLRFDFSRATLTPLLAAVQEELSRLPD